MTHKKASKSKIFTLLFSLIMCLAFIPSIAKASPTSTVYAEGETLTPYDRIYINNNPLNNGYHLKTSDGDQLKGNPDTGYVAKYKDGVLTLNNFNGGNVGISPAVSGYFTINLIGDNIITDGQNGVFIDGEHEGRVTITSNANGKLTINASSSVSSVWGIACGASVMAKNIDVVIGGNAQVTINATSNGENRQVDGIHARNVTIEDNASVNITAKNTNNSTASQWVAGIFAKNNVTINTNGNIDIDVSVAGGDSAYSYGVRNGKTMTKAGNMTIKYKKAGSNGWPITGGDVDNTTHAVNEDSGNCFASYRYGTPRYVAAINGTLAGPGVPKEANSGSGYFLAGDEITLNAPSLQVNEERHVYAKFIEKEMHLFNAYPTEAGYITENGQEIDFGNGRRVEKGTQITLTAHVKVEGYRFVGWYTSTDQSETLISTDATYTFIVNENMSVFSKFEKIEEQS